MKKIVAVFLLILSGYVLVGCNTMHGFGKDVEKFRRKAPGKPVRFPFDAVAMQLFRQR
jgi:predicted small secreted protein